MHSHHSHSGEYCTHATGDLESCIEEAIRQKFDLFCLTEHIPRYRESDLYPGETESLEDLMDMFHRYHTHARALQAKYAGTIELLVGLESEFIRAIDLRVLELLIARYPIDVMVGSVHHVNSIPVDFDRATWQRALSTCRDEEDFYGHYFDHQHEVLRRFKPQVIGHFDVILLFAPDDTNLLHWPSVTEKIIRNIEFVVSYGGLFELNAASFRKGWTTAYPKPNLVKLIQSRNGQFCLSDDSHGPHHVGLNYDKMKTYIQDMNITSLARLKTKTSSTSSTRHQRVEVEVEHNEALLNKFLQWTTRDLEVSGSAE